MNRDIVVALVLGVAVVGGFFLAKPPVVNVDVPAPIVQNLGASQNPGFPVKFVRVHFGDNDGTLQSATVAAGASTSTLTAAQVCNNSVISVALPAAPGVVTFPTAAQMAADCLSRDLDYGSVTIFNASTTAFALAAGASTTVDLPNVTGATTTVPARSFGTVNYTRFASSSQLWVIWQVNP